MKIRLKLQLIKCYGIVRKGLLQSENCNGTILLNLSRSFFPVIANQHLRINEIGYQFIVNDKCLLCIFLVVKWNSEGCFKEHKRAAKRVLRFRFASIKGINNEDPDIEKVFNMCRVAAEQKGYEIFAIRVRRNLEMLFTLFCIRLVCYVITYYVWITV